MLRVSAPGLAPSTESHRKQLQGAATNCSGNFGRVCRALWPDKTAENFASVRGCSVRTASYKIAGRYEIDALDLITLNVEITKR